MKGWQSGSSGKSTYLASVRPQKIEKNLKITRNKRKNSKNYKND
jgi:hypothetical protein